MLKMLYYQQMGAKPSIKIQTPEFVEADWEYQPPQNQNNPEYGMFRTLSNRKTGEMIDEFDMSWANQEEYSYYLKSFNWRYNQPNVVNTRYIVQKSKHEFCAQTYVARVYIQHVIVRLSEINDIPFPQNLYVLMEALEGYAKIFEHSKYFVIEENQICVDAMGNVKIWVNSDLSINYPNSDLYEDDKNAGEQMMVEKLVHLIAENTDRQSEPQLTFLEYFEEKKGFKGKKFQEARVLVLTYARLHETQIPDKFEAVLNLAGDQQTVQQNEYAQEDFTGQPLYNRQPYEQTPQWDSRGYPSQRFPPDGHRPAGHPIAVIPPPAPIQYPVQPLYSAPYQPYSTQNNSSVSFGPKSFGSINPIIYGGYPIQQIPPPIQHIPHYTRIEYPVQVVSQPPFVVSQIPPQTFQIQPQPPPPPQQIQFYPQIQGQQQSSKFISRQVQYKEEIPKELQKSRRDGSQQLKIGKSDGKVKLNELESPVDIRVSPQTIVGSQIRVTLYNDPQNFIEENDHRQEYSNRAGVEEEDVVEQASNSMMPQRNRQNEIDKRANAYRNSSNYHQQTQFSEVDDMVAKSLPIKAGYPASNNAPLLNGFGQSDRSAYSHIHSKEHVDSFGLNASGQFKLKDSLQQKLNESDKGRKKMGTMGSTILKVPSKPVVKYYYSLQDQLQIDPDIAADMERYLAT